MADNGRDLLARERLRLNDLITNTSNRLLICMCIDTSYSMLQENRIDHVNKAVRDDLIEQCKNNIYAADSVEVCIVTFGGKARVVQNFANVKDVKFKDLEVDGDTPLGEAVMLAMNLIKERQAQFDDFGISGFKPWLIIMSDGAATDDISFAKARVKEAVERNELKIMCIDMSNGGETSLSEFTPNGGLPIDALKIEDFFSMLSRAAASMSTAAPGEDEFMNDILTNDEREKLRERK